MVGDKSRGAKFAAGIDRHRSPARDRGRCTEHHVPCHSLRAPMEPYIFNYVITPHVHELI